MYFCGVETVAKAYGCRAMFFVTTLLLLLDNRLSCECVCDVLQSLRQPLTTTYFLPAVEVVMALPCNQSSYQPYVHQAYSGDKIGIMHSSLLQDAPTSLVDLGSRSERFG